MNRYWLTTFMMACGTCNAATPWESYLANPSPQSAVLVSVVSYSNQPDAEHDQTDSDLGMLESQVIAQDAASVDLAFRLRYKLDGAAAEDVDIMLGRLIRANPRLFLKTLAAHSNKYQSFDGPVGNLGDPFVDRWQAQIYETTRRIEALSSVHDSNLKSVRNRCVAELRRQLKEERKAQSMSP